MPGDSYGESIPVKFFSSPRAPSCKDPSDRGSRIPKRRVDEHLDELARLHQVTRHSALRAKWRDEAVSPYARTPSTSPPGDAANVSTRSRGNPRVLVEAVPDVIAIEKIVRTPAHAGAFPACGQRRLAAPDRRSSSDPAAMPGQPPGARLMDLDLLHWMLSARRSAKAACPHPPCHW